METTHKEFADGLRAIADWYEKNPHIPIPRHPSINNYSVNTKGEAAAILRALGQCEKEYDENMFTLSHKFGPIVARFVFYRESVCVKKVVGTREIAETVLPAREETIIPAHKEEIFEWECLPILASEGESNQGDEEITT